MTLRRFLASLAIAVIAGASLAGCGETNSCGAGGAPTGDACQDCATARDSCLDACKDDACKDGCYMTNDSCYDANCPPVCG